MWPFRTSIAQLTEPDLQALIPDVREDYRLDYKQEIQNHNNQNTREMLKDVISLANASGGYLIIGISENQTLNQLDGTPTSADGIDDGDKEQKWIEDICHQCIKPQIVGLKVRDVPLANGKSCVAVSVPNSLNTPHIYEHRGKREFFQRHERQNLPMSIDQIRESVLSTYRASEEYRDYVERQKLSATKFAKGRLSVWFYTAPFFVKMERVDINDKALDAMFTSPPRITALSLPSRLRDPLPLIDGLESTDTTDRNLSRLRILNSGFVDFIECNFEVGQRRLDHYMFEQYAYWWSKFSSVVMGDYLAGEALLFGIQIFNSEKTYMEIDNTLAQRRGIRPRVIEDLEIIVPELRIASESEWKSSAKKMAERVYRAYGYRNAPNFNETGELHSPYPNTVYGWEPMPS